MRTRKLFSIFSLLCTMLMSYPVMYAQCIDTRCSGPGFNDSVQDPNPPGCVNLCWDKTMKGKVLFGNCVPSGKLCDSKICVEAKNCLNANTNVNTPTTALISATSLVEFDTPQRLGLDGFEIHYQRGIIESGASQLGMEYVIVVRSDGRWKRTGGPDGEKVGTIPDVPLKNLASEEYHTKHKQLARKDVVLGREVFVLSAVNKGLMIEKSYATDIPVPLFIKLTYDRQTLIDEAVQIIPRQVTDDEVAPTK